MEKETNKKYYLSIDYNNLELWLTADCNIFLLYIVQEFTSTN